ncbi:MAG: O-antigen ligase family protein [Planctomycetes bacterium]|nr:O-antigen ligase family protein [Planctomycetota bacterium]
MRKPGVPVSAAILGAAIALRSLVAWAPTLRFDVDPVFDPASFAGLGPSASLWIDAVIALSAAFILAECASLWALGLLVVAGLASISILGTHATAAAGAPWRGTTWLAGFVAAAAGVSLAASARDSAKMGWAVLVTCLVSVAAAWWTRGAWQWFVEQPAVVDFFRSNGRDLAYFAEHGWDADGPQAAAYVRRLSQREMSGWFGLANIFAGLFAAATVLFAALGIRLSGRDRVLAIVATVLCAAVPLANGSKGAIVAMVIGLGFLAAARHSTKSRNALAAGAIALLLLAMFAAPLRAFFSPDAFGQERSLLFRSHYIVGAWRIFLDRPCPGSGIDGFQDAFLSFRPADAVDAVQSSHAVFFDWLAQIGAAGIPMIAAVFALTVMSSRASGDRVLAAVISESRFPRLLATLAIAAAAVLALRCEAHALDLPALAARLAGAALSGVAAWWIFPIILRWGSTPAPLLAAAALTVWIDGQIETTIWNPGSMVWACALLSVSVPRFPSERRQWFAEGVRWFAAVAAMLFALSCLHLARGANAEEARVERAAQHLLDAAEAAKGEPGPAARIQSARILCEGSATPTDLSMQAAIDQLIRASTLAKNPTQALEMLHEARQLSDRLGSRTFTQRQNASLLREHIAAQTHTDADATAAMEAALAVTEMDPRCAGAWLRAARWAAKLSRPVAGEYARRAIESDDSMHFDVLLKLRPADRLEAEQLRATWSKP